MIKPVRFQRKRARGWNMQEESRRLNGLPAVYVGRPTVWGNPFGGNREEAVAGYREWIMSGLERRDCCTGHLYAALDARVGYPHRDKIIARLPELRDRNLCCWCSLFDKGGKKIYCHADVLLKLANEE